MAEKTLSRKKFFICIFLLVFFALPVGPVQADGLVCEWEPFAVKSDPTTGVSSQGILKSVSFSREMWRRFSNNDYLAPEETKVDKSYPLRARQQSGLSKIKISLSQVNTFLLSPDEDGPPGRSVKFSDIAGIVPSLFKNPSQETAIQTLKLIQPQVNLGFEF